MIPQTLAHKQFLTIKIMYKFEIYSKASIIVHKVALREYKGSIRKMILKKEESKVGWMRPWFKHLQIFISIKMMKVEDWKHIWLIKALFSK